MASNKKQTAANAEAELKDLDVKEVSIVDRPANRRKFLIIKRDKGGSLTANVEDQEMQTEEIKKESAAPVKSADVLDLLGLGLVDGETAVAKGDEDEAPKPAAEDEKPAEDAEAGDAPAEAKPAEDAATAEGEAAAEEKPAEETPPEVPLEAVQKGEAGAVYSAISKAMGELTIKVSAAKDAEALAVEALAEVSAIGKSLIESVEGEGGEATDEGEADPLAIVKSSLDGLMGLANELKPLVDTAEKVPAEVAQRLQTVAKRLEVLAVSDTDEPATEENEAAPVVEEPALQAFVEPGENDDPEVILKAGAKMRKARLTEFKKAVDTLVSLLAELDESAKAQKGEGEPKTEMKKSDEETKTQDVGALLAKGFEALETKIDEKLGEVTKKVEEVTKRVDEVEGANSGGQGDADTTNENEPIEKSDEGGKSLWGNLFS